MKRTAISLIISALLLALVLSCSDDSNPSAPAEEAPQRLALTIDLLPAVLCGPPGVEQTVSFIVSTLVNGAPAAGKVVNLVIETGPGSLSSNTVLTGEDGTADVQYRVSIAPRSNRSEVVIGAVCDSAHATGSITLMELPQPARLSLQSDAPVVFASEGESALIHLTAVVFDSLDHSLSDVNMRFWLAPYMEEDSSFGSLTCSHTTDANGEISLTFNSRGGYGKVKVGAGLAMPYDESMQTFAEIEVRRMTDNIQSLTAQARPNRFVYTLAETFEFEIAVAARNRNLEGVSGVPILVRPQYGVIRSAPETDADGLSRTVLTLRPEMDFPAELLGQTINVAVNASVPGTDWSVSVVIIATPLVNPNVRLSLTTDAKNIWADGPGGSQAHLTARLTTEAGDRMSGEPICFCTSSWQGLALSPVSTDSSGQASSYFDDLGTPSTNNLGQPDSVAVTAIHQPSGASASLKISIRELPVFGGMTLAASSRILEAGSGARTDVMVSAWTSKGQTLDPGWEVRLVSKLGSFTDAAPKIGASGSAHTTYIAGRRAGLDSLRAFVRMPSDSGYSNYLTIDLTPGSPAAINMTAEPDVVFANDPNADCIVTAEVIDANRNPIRAGNAVNFIVTIGSVQPPTVLTTTNGKAVSRYHPSASGEAVITARTPGLSGMVEGTTTVTVLRGLPSSLTVEMETDTLIQRGFAGIDSSRLRIYARDVAGNLLEVPTPLVVEMVNEMPPPAGSGFEMGESIIQRQELTLVEGVATTYVRAGTAPGRKTLRAYTWRDAARQDTVQTTFHFIVMTSEVDRLSLYINLEGWDAGGDEWALQVWADAFKEQGTAASDNIPIEFGTDSDDAYISDGYTGNADRNGNRHPGRACTVLYYPGFITYEETSITARVLSAGRIIEARRVIKLPLQQGRLIMEVRPHVWVFQGDDDNAQFQITATLRDGHEDLINNVPIRFEATRGRFYRFNENTRDYVTYHPRPAIKLTGVRDRENNEMPGHATVFLMGPENIFFLDNFTQEVNVQITSHVDGDEEVSAEQVFVTVLR